MAGAPAFSLRSKTDPATLFRSAKKVIKTKDVELGRGLRAAGWPYLTYPQPAAEDEGDVLRFAQEAHRIRGPLHPTHFNPSHDQTPQRQQSA